MKCFHCENEACAVCKLCGRAVCAEHVQEQSYVSGFTGKFGFWSRGKNAVRVDDAVWCGACHPVYESTA
jgi:hypothetical protein